MLRLAPDTAPMPLAQHIQPLKSHFIREHLLTQDETTLIYCAELHEHDLIDVEFTKVPLRRALETLGDAWFVMAAKAANIIQWDKNHQYCGRCAQPTTHQSPGFERRCQPCGLTFYPRISPSIIVLIQKDDEILMARSAHFMPGIYGFIAGFVEPGESIEDTVHREVMEEVGLKVKNLRYFGSQAWPFPDSLMLAFFADYDSGTLTIDTRELEDAGWYHYSQLPGRPSSQLSIASKLLDAYLRSKAHGHS